MEEYVRQYIDYLKAENEVSATTLVAYRRTLKKYVAFISQKGIVNPEEIRQEIIEDYLKMLNLTGLKPETLASQCTHIKGFHQYLALEVKLTTSDPTVKLERPRITRKLSPILSIQEVNNLIMQPDVSTAIGLRDRAIIEMLYATGITLQELQSLTLPDLMFEQKLIRCTGKGRKLPFLPIGEYAIRATYLYIEKSRNTFVKENSGETVFISQRGGSLSRKTIWNIIREYAYKAGIRKAINFHSIRHAFAAHLLQNGADFQTVYALLGHKDMITTEIYENIWPRRPKERQQNISPSGID